MLQLGLVGWRYAALSTHGVESEAGCRGAKKKKGTRGEEDARPDLEYGLGGGVPHSLSSSGRRRNLMKDIYPPSSRSNGHWL